MKYFVALLLAVVSAFGQGKINARVQNFEANPERDGKRIFLKGADRTVIANGINFVKQPHVETFKLDGTVDMIIDAAEAYFDQPASQDVWSEKDLSTRSGDGRLSVKGLGFRWQTAQSQLSISNKVDAVIRREALQTAGSSTNQIHVTSNAMTYNSELVTFTGNVHVVDAQGEVWCRLLKVKFGEGNTLQQIEAIDEVVLKQNETTARGKRALYNPATGLLRLTEGTSWEMGERNGESELLIVDRTNNTYRAETKVRMTLPSSLITTNTSAANTNKITIRADTFDYAPTNQITHGPIAIYNGNVHAIDPQANLDCELLTIYFNQTNKLVRAVAERAVQITRPLTSVRGEKAVFENDEVTVTGKPVWQHEEKSGSSEVLVFNPRTSEIRAVDVTMQIPFTSGTNSLLGISGKTNAASVTNILLVTSKYFTNREKVATFAQNVRATEPRGQLDATLVNVYFNATNRPTRILADGDVIITETQTQALGQRADYDVTAGHISLTGAPKVMNGTNYIIAKEIQFDRNSGKVKYLPPFLGELTRTNATSKSK